MKVNYTIIENYENLNNFHILEYKSLLLRTYLYGNMGRMWENLIDEIRKKLVDVTEDSRSNNYLIQTVRGRPHIT